MPFYCKGVKSLGSWSSRFEHSEVSQQPASLSQVGPSHPASGVHAGGKLSASIGHAKSKQSATASHVDIVEKTGHLKCKLNFPCMLCEGDHLTHKCPAITEVQRVWSKTQEFPSQEQPIVSQHPTQPLVDQVVEPISALVDPTLLSESDLDVIEPMSSLFNPNLPLESVFHEVVKSIPLSINPTLPLESEVSASHIFFTTISELTEQGGTKLTLDEP